MIGRLLSDLVPILVMDTEMSQVNTLISSKERSGYKILDAESSTSTNIIYVNSEASKKCPVV